MIVTLIRRGYLPFERRHDANAVRVALAKLKAAAKTSVKPNTGGKDPPSAA